MIFKITIVLSFASLLMLGSVLAQTNANRQTNSNIAANFNRPTNVSNVTSDRRPTATPRPEFKSVACQYLTESDAADIFGKPMIYYTSTTYQKELKCIYMPPNDFPFGVTLKIETYPTVRQAEAKIKLMVKEAELINLQYHSKEFPNARMPVPKIAAGIGDSAYFATTGDNFEYVYFQKDSTVLEISVLGKTGSNFDENTLKSAAKKIAGNFESNKN